MQRLAPRQQKNSLGTSSLAMAHNVELEEVLPRWKSGPEKGRPDRLTVHTASLAVPPVAAQQLIEALLVAA